METVIQTPYNETSCIMKFTSVDREHLGALRLDQIFATTPPANSLQKWSKVTHKNHLASFTKVQSKSMEHTLEEWSENIRLRTGNV